MVDIYKYGDISIPKKKFHDLLDTLKRKPVGTFDRHKGKQEYYWTYEILKEYQGFIARNENINVGDSWNAHFGRIIKQCSRDTGKIKEIRSKVQIIVDGGKTNNSEWLIV